MTSWDSQNKGTVEIYTEDDQLISKVNVGFSLSSAFVNNGTIYIFGSNEWDKESNSIYMISSTDLINWTTEIKVYDSPSGVVIYNNSITKNDTKFIMSYEVCKSGDVCFNIRFLESDDLISWKEVGAPYKVGQYVACPTIKYHDGYYYMLYAVQIYFPACETKISRSKDLINWEEGNIVITPRDGNSLGICDSDVDFVEHQGKLNFLFLEGDQKTWFNLRRAEFPGNMDSFINASF